MAAQSAVSAFGGALREPVQLAGRFGLPGLTLDKETDRASRARVVGATIGALTLAEIKEDLPRTAIFEFPNDRVFFGLPSDFGPPHEWDGVALPYGAVMVHAPGSRAQSRTHGWSRWCIASLPLGTYARWTRVLLGASPPIEKPWAIPDISPAEVLSFLRLLFDAVRLVHDTPALLSHPEAAKSLEHELILGLLALLDSGNT